MEYYREKSVGDGGRNWREEECRWGTGGRCWGSTSCLGYGALTEDRFRFCVSDSGDSAAKSSAGPSTTPHAAATSRCIGRRSGTQQPGPPPTPPQSHILTERGSVSFFGVSLSMRLVCCSVLYFSIFEFFFLSSITFSLTLSMKLLTLVVKKYFFITIRETRHALECLVECHSIVNMHQPDATPV